MERDVQLRKEGDGKGYYERRGSGSGIPELSSIFAMISDDEIRHAAALRALQDGGKVELAESPTLAGARLLLRRLHRKDLQLSGFQGDLRAYSCAMNSEAASARLYGQLAREASDGWEKDLFLKMAEQDEIHFTLLEQMRELLEFTCCTGSREGGVADAN